MMAPKTDAAARELLSKELVAYLSTNRDRAVRGRQGYEFDIKIHKVHIPPMVRKLMDEKTIDERFEEERSTRLFDFAEDLREQFPWIGEWQTTGRSGGWLLLLDQEPVLNDDWQVEGPLKDARAKVKDLEKIAKLVSEGKQKFIADMESPDWWGVTPHDWVPPKKPAMGGMFDFLKKKPKDPALPVHAVPLESVPYSGSMLPAGPVDNPFEMLSPPPAAAPARGLTRYEAPQDLSVFDALGPAPARPAAPSQHIRLPAPPAAPVQENWGIFEPPALPPRPRRDPGSGRPERRRIDWRLPSADEMIRRFNPKMLSRIYSDVRAARNTSDFARRVARAAAAGLPGSIPVKRIAEREIFGELADYFGVPYEVLDTYERAGDMSPAIWDELFYPLFDTLSEALEIEKPRDLPGWFAMDYDADSGAWDLDYFEA